MKDFERKQNKNQFLIPCVDIKEAEHSATFQSLKVLKLQK